ncbi:MAG: pilus assembly protein PilM [Oscillospiraceae bacterium]|nr:pilus assembly protein PilM [Oscillospiraceae bacterium]
MKASIHISTYMVEVLSYTKSGKSVNIHGYKTAPLPEECVINGVILDGGPVVEALKSLAKQDPGLFKDVSLVIDGSFVYTKRITVPAKLGKWAYDQVIRDEFAEIASDVENLVCDFIPIGINPDGSKQILACAVERAHAETYLGILRAAGITPSIVRIGIQAILKYISTFPKLKETPFILCLVDGEMLLSMIFQNGECVFQSRARLFGEDRASLIQNSLLGLSGIVQFNKSQKFEDIKHCLYVGIDDNDLQVIRENNTYPEIQFGILDLFRGVKGAERLPPNAHISFMNSLMPETETDLLHSIRMAEKAKRRNRPKKTWMPIIIGVAAVLIAAIAILLVLVLSAEREVRDLEAYLNSQKVLDEKAELASLNSSIATANRLYNEALEKIAATNDLPSITRGFINMIVTTGGDDVRITGFTFNENDGSVRASATAYDEFAASSYIEQLRANPMVSYVGYLGWSGSAGTFTFSFEVRENQEGN